MKIESIVSRDYAENTCLVHVKDGIVVIDPGGPAEQILSAISKSGMKIKYILLTHGHYDHITAAESLKADVYAHETEKPLLEDASKNLSAYAGTGAISLKNVKYYSGKKHEMDGFEFFHTPGHTAGCVVIKAGDSLFTGDTLFVDTVGRTDLPTGDSKELKESLKLFDGFDTNLKCYPGHGEPFILGNAYKVNHFIKKN